MPEKSQWKEYQDFTGGLWERGNDREVPENGLLTLIDAYPIATGGLRAGPKWLAENVVNLPTTDLLYSFQTAWEENNLDGFSAAIMTVPTGIPTSAQTVSLRTQGVDLGAANIAFLDNWSAAAALTHTGVNRFIPVRWFNHVSDDTGGIGGIASRWYYVIYSSTLGQSGLWRNAAGFGVNGVPVSRFQNVEFISGTSFQSSIVVTKFLPAESRLGRLAYTLPGVDNNFTSAQFIDASPETPSDIAHIFPIHPNDLIILKTGHGLHHLQGTLNNPTINELTLHAPPQMMTNTQRTPVGLVYMTRNNGMWVWKGGDATEHLSPQLVGSPFLGEYYDSRTNVIGFGPPPFIGDCAYAYPFIFTPKGYVYDIRTNAWFKTSLPGLPGTNFMYPFWSYNPRTRILMAAGNEGTTGGTIKIIALWLDEVTMARASTYSFTLPPLSLDDRRIEVRELEFHIHSFRAGGGGNQITVTITKQDATTVAKTSAIDASGSQVVRVDIDAFSDAVKIQVSMESGSATFEAPQLQRMRVRYVETSRYA